MTDAAKTFFKTMQPIDELIRRAIQASSDAKNVLSDADRLLSRRTELLLQHDELLCELMTAARGVCSAVSNSAADRHRDG